MTGQSSVLKVVDYLLLTTLQVSLFGSTAMSIEAINQEEIAGFQFNFEGALVADAESDVLSASASDLSSIVVGFSAAGDTVPISMSFQELVLVEFSAPPLTEICLVIESPSPPPPPSPPTPDVTWEIVPSGPLEPSSAKLYVKNKISIAGYQLDISGQIPTVSSSVDVWTMTSNLADVALLCLYDDRVSNRALPWCSTWTFLVVATKFLAFCSRS